MKEDQLRKHSTCDVCQEKIGKSGVPMFWTATITRHGLKADAIMRQDGLAKHLQSPLLAGVMGTNEDMTQIMFGPKTITICEACATKQICLM